MWRCVAGFGVESGKGRCGDGYALHICEMQWMLQGELGKIQADFEGEEGRLDASLQQVEQALQEACDWEKQYHMQVEVAEVSTGEGCWPHPLTDSHSGHCRSSWRAPLRC